MITALLFVFLSVSDAESTVWGTVYDENGFGMPNAYVFLEPDLFSPLIRVQTDENGRFKFSSVKAGKVGVFAFAPGKSFSGVSPSVGFDDEVGGIMIRMSSPVSVEGKVVDPAGNPISGARVERIALLAEDKVAIPFDKLGELGIDAPTTDASGRFVVNNVPAGKRLALKIVHPSYAQVAVDDVDPQGSIKIVMEPGVFVRGRVYVRGTTTGVANVNVLFRSDVPPYDTVLARTNLKGEFAVRLRPAVYASRVESENIRSLGWEKVSVPPSGIPHDIVLYASKAATIHGKVLDAATREPVAGARLSLYAADNLADVGRTNSDGIYRFRVGEGDSIVELVAAPGYQVPRNNKVKVFVPAGQEVEMPVFWLVRNPSVTLRVEDEQGRPVVDGAVSMFRPQQLGLQRTDENGRASVRVAFVPDDGVVVGFVEDPNAGKGAVFHCDVRTVTDMRVVVKPFVRVQGKVLNKRNEPVQGVIVFAKLANAPGTGEPEFLWRTISQSDGSFAWDWCPAGVRISCGASDGVQTSQEVLLDVLGTPDADQPIRLVLDTREKQRSFSGDVFPWGEALLPTQARPEPTGKSSLILFCSSQEALIMANVIEMLRQSWGFPIQFVFLVEDESKEKQAMEPTVLFGKRPGLAGGYLLDKDGKVVLETFGIPPLSALHALGKGLE